MPPPEQDNTTTCDSVTKLCKEKTTVTLNRKNINILIIIQGEARHKKYKKLKLDGGQALSRQGLHPWTVRGCI
jgi:hypothetical protein